MTNEKQYIEDVDGTIYTFQGHYNTETKKPYVEVLKDGKHYAYMPWSILTKNQRNKIN